MFTVGRVRNYGFFTCVIDCHSLSLTICSLVTSCGDTDLGQHWLRSWLHAWRHQGITATNVDLSPLRSCGINLRTSPEEHLKIPVSTPRSTMAFSKLHPGLLDHRKLKQHPTWYILTKMSQAQICSESGIRKIYWLHHCLITKPVVWRERFCCTNYEICDLFHPYLLRFSYLRFTNGGLVIHLSLLLGMTSRGNCWPGSSGITL